MARKKITAAAEAASEIQPTEVTADPSEKQDDAAEAKSQAGEEKLNVYIGADLPGVKSGTVFSGGIPEKLNRPYINELVVPLSELTTALKKKSITESHIAYCYRKSAEYARELGK